MADSGPSGLGDAGHRLSGLDQPLREPGVAGVRPEEIAGPQDQQLGTPLRRPVQPPLHLDADGALAGQRALRRGFVDLGKDVRAVIVDGARQQDAGLVRPRRRRRVVEHRQHQRVPVPVARRVDGVDDQRRAIRRRRDVRRVHGVAGDPGHRFGSSGSGGGGVAGQRPHRPAPRHQRPRQGAADAAAGPQNQGDPAVRRHAVFLPLPCLPFRPGQLDGVGEGMKLLKDVPLLHENR